MTRRVFCVCALAWSISVSGLALQNAAQDQRIDWNARAPWGPQDHSEPVELQKKEPYRIFDNVWQVGIQTATVWLITSTAGHFLFDATADETAPLVLDNIRKAAGRPGFPKRPVDTRLSEKHRALEGARPVGCDAAEPWRHDDAAPAP